MFLKHLENQAKCLPETWAQSHPLLICKGKTSFDTHGHGFWAWIAKAGWQIQLPCSIGDNIVKLQGIFLSLPYNFWKISKIKKGYTIEAEMTTLEFDLLHLQVMKHPQLKLGSSIGQSNRTWNYSTFWPNFRKFVQVILIFSPTYTKNQRRLCVFYLVLAHSNLSALALSNTTTWPAYR